jgi:hypothetical protein
MATDIKDSQSQKSQLLRTSQDLFDCSLPSFAPRPTRISSIRFHFHEGWTAFICSRPFPYLLSTQALTYLSLGDDWIVSPCRHSIIVTEMPQLTASLLYPSASFLLWRMQHSHSPLASNPFYCWGYKLTLWATSRHAKIIARELSPSPINAPCLATTSYYVFAAVPCLSNLRWDWKQRVTAICFYYSNLVLNAICHTIDTYSVWYLQMVPWGSSTSCLCQSWQMERR